MNAKSIRQQFADTMNDVGQKDPRLAVMVGDISHTVLQPYAKACPGRYYNIGICEPTMMSMAAGLAKVGFYPVVHTIAPFLVERSFEQMKLDFVYHKLGGNVITVGSAFDYSNLGCTHHCYGDFALMKTLEGSQIIYPGSASEFDCLFKQTYTNGALKLFRIPGKSHEAIFTPAQISFGKAIKVSDGKDLTLIATGPQLSSAVGAAESLKNKKVSTDILYIHTIRPLDKAAILESVKKTKKVIVIEEHMQSGGLGDDVLRLIREIGDVKFESVSIPDSFVRGYGHYEDHCQALGLSPQGVVEKAEKILKK